MSAARGQVPCRHHLQKASACTSARTAARGRRCVVDATVGNVCAALSAAAHGASGSVSRPGAATSSSGDRPAGSTVIDATFFVPATPAVPATVTAFGAVFTDVKATYDPAALKAQGLRTWRL